MSEIALAPEIERAVSDGRAVVALETTLVTHGLPHPEGVAAARAMEAAVRDGGAIPATIGILDGRIHVGLSLADLERLATTPGIAKLNLSNLAAHLAPGVLGSTTVAATMFAAHRAGIQVFATGGIGGVHRNAAETDDVSADLTALARFPVAVVCSGAKAVLDLARTVERLETLGVPIFGVGTDSFPAFYHRSSGLPVDRRFDDMASLATAVRLHFRLGLGTGIVVANPIPAEHEPPTGEYEAALVWALEAAERQQVRGRSVTPFLLERLRERTQGLSVVANRALLLDNARVAAALAAAIVAGR